DARNRRITDCSRGFKSIVNSYRTSNKPIKLQTRATFTDRLTSRAFKLTFALHRKRDANREKRPLCLHWQYLSKSDCRRIVSPANRESQRHRRRFGRRACGSWPAAESLRGAGLRSGG